MCQKNDLPLSLKSDTFNALCSDYDQILRSTLQGMEETEQDTAEINIKVKITLTPDSAPDFEVRNQTRSVTKPKFDHTVSSVIQHKEKKIGSLAGNYELVWDRETCQYVMRPIDNGQINLFEEQREDGERGVVSGEVIDADFKEVQPLEGRKLMGLPGDVAEATAESRPSFDQLKEYVGKELCCEWTEDESTIVIRCLNDGEVLLDAKDYPELEKHLGHDIICVAIEHNGAEIASIECDTCGATLYMAERPVQNIDTETPYGWLRQFVGVPMKLLEAMGNYTVRTDDNKVVLSSATSPDDTFYAPAEKLAPHVGHTIVCVIYGDKDAETNISIECEDCKEALFSLDAPVVVVQNEAQYGEDGYPYEAPDGEGETA